MFNSGDQLMFQCQSRQFQIQRNNYNTNDSGSNFHELAPNCPRCASPNTKFCYYNNYSLSQPRYFCKGCRRYWTKGGSLRNVPVGGGCRKSRRANSKSRVQSVYSQRSDGDRASSQESPNNGGGSDIDLAVVFAKFLNEDNSSSSTVVSEGNVDQIDQFGINNVSNSPTFDSYQSNQSVTIQDSDFFDRLPDQVLENGFGIQNLGGYEDQMGLWIDDGSWETGLMPFDQHHQDLDYGFTNLLDDQIKISANLMNQENWSSFDTSGFNYS